jgi:hypothetical protein
MAQISEYAENPGTGSMPIDGFIVVDTERLERQCCIVLGDMFPKFLGLHITPGTIGGEAREAAQADSATPFRDYSKAHMVMENLWEVLRPFQPPNEVPRRPGTCHS